MAMLIRILLADDHKVLRQGMAQVLETQGDMTVVAQANDGIQAVELARIFQPDLILMDINMPGMDGVEATRLISEAYPEIKIIILTMHRRDEYIFQAIMAGANGYLLKEAELDQLLAAIRSVSRGEAVMDPAIAGRVLAQIRKPRSVISEPHDSMPERDLEVLRCVALGLTNKEIADKLFISEKTVRNRLSIMFRQLKLTNRTQVTLYAIRKGLVDPFRDE